MFKCMYMSTPYGEGNKILLCIKQRTKTHF